MGYNHNSPYPVVSVDASTKVQGKIFGEVKTYISLVISHIKMSVQVCHC